MGKENEEELGDDAEELEHRRWTRWRVILKRL
jgi:hypothetical protein